MTRRVSIATTVGLVVAVAIFVSLLVAGETDPGIVFVPPAFWGCLTFLWVFSKSSSGSPNSQALTDGAEHLKLFPLLCQKGNRAHKLVQSGKLAEATEELRQILGYLAVKGIIDQFLLGKAYLALLACAQRDGKPLGSVLGEWEAGLGGAARKIFADKLLAPKDQAAYESVQAKKDVVSQLSPWELSSINGDSLKVIRLYPDGKIFCICTLEKATPPKLVPGSEDLNLNLALVKK